MDVLILILTENYCRVYGVNNHVAFFVGGAAAPRNVLSFVILYAREKIMLNTSISSRDTYKKFVIALIYCACKNRRGFSRMSRGEHRECRHLCTAPYLINTYIPT